MTLLRVYEDQAYWPEYSTFCVRDVPGPGRDEHRGSGLLAEYAVDTQPCGSIARAGDGWVDGVASSDERHSVRIEVHDAPPEDDDPSLWNDVVETPFRTSGVIGLEAVVCGPNGEQAELGPPGTYRMRFARRPLTRGDNAEGSPCAYLLRFWPVDAPVEPPRWLRRTDPLIDERAEQDAFAGLWRRAVSDVVMLALWAAESGTPVTLGWLADRLLTTTATVRGIIEHPKADGVLSVAGSLDDVDAPLTVTVHARKPRTDTFATASVAGRRSIPGLSSLATRQTPATRVKAARPSVAARPGVAGHPKVAARRAVPRQDAAGTEQPQPRRDGSDGRPDGGAGPEKAG